MKWFVNLGIAYKLALGFGVCLVLALIAGVAALQRMATMDQAATRISSDSVKGQDILVEIISDVKQFRAWQIRYGVMKDKAGWDQCDSNINDLEAAVDQQMQEYKAHATDPADVDNIKALAKDWQATIAAHADVRRVCMTNLSSNADVQNVIVTSYIPAKACNERLDKMIKWNTKHADDLAASAHQTYVSAWREVFALLAFTIILGLAAATFVTKFIVRMITLINGRLADLDMSFTDLSSSIEAVAMGDLTPKKIRHTDFLHMDQTDEFGKLANTFDSMLTKAKKSTTAIVTAQEGLSQLIGTARGTAESIAESSDQLSTGNQDLATRTSSQASSLEETAASMEQMTSVVKQSADNARNANVLASETRAVAQSGGKVVEQAVESMREINASSKRISDIVTVIDEIAFQTNLLALNAAVEAARVGEQGKGFAVVAAEVRSLAGRSSTAAKEIKALVQDSVQKVESGTELVNKSGKQLAEIVHAVERVAKIVEEISSAAQEQSLGIDQVNKAVGQLDEITQQNAALVEESTEASRTISHQASELRELVHKFKLDNAQWESQGAGTSSRNASRPAQRTTLRVVGGNDVEEF
jgi:methyl-accepting chemotaxis protein